MNLQYYSYISKWEAISESLADLNINFDLTDIKYRSMIFFLLIIYQ